MITKKTLTQYLSGFNQIKDNNNNLIDKDYILKMATFIDQLTHPNWFSLSSYQLSAITNLDDFSPTNILYKITPPHKPHHITPLAYQTPQDFIYFNESIPLVKKYFTVHHTIFLESKARQLLAHITNKNNKNKIKPADIQALRLILEKTATLLEEQSKPNKHKILVYFPPKYLIDLDVKSPLAHKLILKNNLHKTFAPGESEPKQELISEEIKRWE